MSFNHTHYVPCLRWKMGEYQTVSRLPPTTKRVFTPIIEIPELGWDFEEEKEKRTIDQLLSGFAFKKIYKKWGRFPCFVDLNLIPLSERMKSGVHPLCFIFNELRAIQCVSVPVTGLIRDEEYQKEIKKILDKDKRGICLRITIEQASKITLKTEIDSLLSTLKIRSVDCDLILDLGAPNFVPLEGFSKAIQLIVSSFPYLKDWRTFTVLGSSFPETMASIEKGGKVVERYEWQLYKMLITNFRRDGVRLPSFGDYAINHPKVLELDMRKVKPSATIRYTIDDNWYIVKGENVRDKKYGRCKQYLGLSKKVIDSKYYYGSTFSWGDDFIQRCANGGNTSNLSMWRQVGTTHHIVKVIRDIASFYAS
jgi:Beta protein